MTLWIVFVASALTAFGVAPIAARGDRLSGYGVWGVALVLCLGTAGVLIDMAFNPAV